MAHLGFNAENVVPAGVRQLVPAGNYSAHIVHSDMVDNNSGNGKNLVLTWEILEPEEYRGSEVRAWLAIINDSNEAQKIAERKLSAIVHAAGLSEVGDSTELHNIPMNIAVSVEDWETKDRDTGEDVVIKVNRYNGIVGLDMSKIKKGTTSRKVDDDKQEEEEDDAPWDKI